MEIFEKFERDTVKVFVNKDANFSPLRPSSPNPNLDKILNSPRRQMNDILNSPYYIPNSPHRINSPIHAFSEYDDKDCNKDNFRFSPSCLSYTSIKIEQDNFSQTCSKIRKNINNIDNRAVYDFNNYNKLNNFYNKKIE